jgi:hypothetical protein
MPDITISTSALVQLLDQFPNPDEVTPFGPAGPVVRGLEWVALNPQPLPPIESGLVALARTATREWGAHADPQRWALATRAVINAHLDHLALVGIIIVGGDQERPVAEIGRSISAMIDEWCGTPPHRGPFPGPWGPVLDSERLHPANLVVAGAQFQKAADALRDNPLHDVFERAAERLFTEGFARLAPQA